MRASASPSSIQDLQQCSNCEDEGKYIIACQPETDRMHGCSRLPCERDLFFCVEFLGSCDLLALPGFKVPECVFFFLHR